MRSSSHPQHLKAVNVNPVMLPAIRRRTHHKWHANVWPLTGAWDQNSMRLVNSIISTVNGRWHFVCNRDLFGLTFWYLNYLDAILTQRGRDKMATIFQSTFSNGFYWMKMYEFLLTFHWSVPGGPLNNIPTLVQVMTWRRPGDKPLSEPMMVRLPKHICVTRPQWVK